MSLDLPLYELSARLSAGDLKVTELITATLERIEETRALNAYLSVRRAPLEAEARAAEARLEAHSSGVLTGIPIAIKDNICVRNAPMTCASRLLADYRSPYDATVVRKLGDAGALIPGKTNLDEFAMGSSTENSAFGPSLNPWSIDRSPGGSSGGSAVAVACGAAAGALGSDTGGSIRLPAALTGTVGLKPTYGRVSRYGLTAHASSLDQIGPITREVRDAAILLSVIQGHDPRDATTLNTPVPNLLQDLEAGVNGLRLGVPELYFQPGTDSAVLDAIQAALDLYQSIGGQLRRIELPPPTQALSTYQILSAAEASSNLARFDGIRYGARQEADSLDGLYRSTRTQGFGPEVVRRIMLGTFALSAGYRDDYYAKAQASRLAIRAALERAFEHCDLIVTPTSPVTAFKLGERTEPLSMYTLDLFTIPASLAGLPAISVPAGLSPEGLPIGLQLMGPALSEARLLRAARAYEREMPWRTMSPPWKTQLGRLP